jgi:hypothetical protein
MAAGGRGRKHGRTVRQASTAARSSRIECGLGTYRDRQNRALAGGRETPKGPCRWVMSMRVREVWMSVHRRCGGGGFVNSDGWMERWMQVVWWLWRCPAFIGVDAGPAGLSLWASKPPASRLVFRRGPFVKAFRAIQCNQVQSLSRLGHVQGSFRSNAGMPNQPRPLTSSVSRYSICKFVMRRETCIHPTHIRNTQQATSYGCVGYGLVCTSRHNPV